MDRLHRISLLLGMDAIEKLQKSTVMVVGCGAVGSFAIEALARSGIGHMILIDFDVVEESNINRQLFALDSTIGKSKVEIARQRIHDINPEIIVDVYNTFFDENTNIDVKPDYVVDAIDTVQSKIALYKWCFDIGVPFISSMGAARKTDVTKIRIDKISRTTTCPLAAKIRRKVRDLKIWDFPVVYSIENAIPQQNGGREFGSVITVTGMFGLMLADFVIKKLSA
ncbi:MAG: tRNA threonylcarbamoyladenosine dehydratase [Alphaproteobacteria bacterium]|nr:tRNA threonylcarbamoyladenosine dehydratase [Alphaproteobacteria bacterium]